MIVRLARLDGLGQLAIPVKYCLIYYVHASIVAKNAAYKEAIWLLTANFMSVILAKTDEGGWPWPATN
jgi:hypothetical protein